MIAFKRAVALSVVLGATCAHAEPIDGRVRLGFDGALLQHTTRNSVTFPEAGLAFPSASDGTTSVTLAAASFGAVFGYATSEHFTIGSRLAYAHSRESHGAFGSSKIQGFDGDLSCAHVFGEASLRPFVGPLLGYSNVNSEFGVANVSEHWFTLGARLGMHAFLAPSFSVDPSLMVGYVTGSGEFPFATNILGARSTYDIDGFVIGINLALSGWLGGKH